MFRIRRMHIVVTLALIFVLGIIANASANNLNSTKSSHVKNLDNFMVKKTEVRLQVAYDDIKTAFNLGETLKDYKLVDFQGGTYKMESSIMQEFEALDQSPIGSTVPQFYLKNDLSAVLVLYKEGDGTNVVKNAKKINNKWVEGEMRLPGAPILDINEINLDN